MTPAPHRPGRNDANALAITGTLAVGPAFWGGVGWGLDRLLGTGFLALVGVVVGAAAGVYLVYVKWGR